MDTVAIFPGGNVGRDFIPAEYLPEGQDEYYLRNQQVSWPKDRWRNLQANEIERLIKNNNDSDNWDEVFDSEFKAPTLIIHDINDKEIDISNARKLAKQWSWAEVMETKRLGHRRILLNPDVITRALNFITESNASTKN